MRRIMKFFFRICVSCALRLIWAFKLDKDIIFIYSDLGFRDNVRALYNYLVGNGYNEKYRIICSLNDWKQYADKCPENVRFMGNRAGILWFMVSRWSFYSFGFYPVNPAPKQTVINLWHGMPLKKIGNLLYGHENTDNISFSKVLATSPMFAEVMARCFNCEKDKVLLCGQPKTDLLFAPSQEKEGDFRILWLPTYRKASRQGWSDETGGDYTDMSNDENCELFKQMDLLLSEYNASLIVKLHPLQDQYEGKLLSLRRISFLYGDDSGLDTYRLMREADVMLTDYSSVMFDFLLLNRPMGYIVGDINKYNNIRGLVFDDPESLMPGEKIRTRDQLIDFISNCLRNKDYWEKKRNSVLEMTSSYRDGNNSERLLNMVGIRTPERKQDGECL